MGVSGSGGRAEFHRRRRCPWPTSEWARRRSRSRCRRSAAAACWRPPATAGLLRQERQRFHPGQRERDARAAQEVTRDSVHVLHRPHSFGLICLSVPHCRLLVARASRPRAIAELLAGDDLRRQLRKRGVAAGRHHAIDQRLVGGLNRPSQRIARAACRTSVRRTCVVLASADTSAGRRRRRSRSCRTACRNPQSACRRGTSRASGRWNRSARAESRADRCASGSWRRWRCACALPAARARRGRRRACRPPESNRHRREAAEPACPESRRRTQSPRFTGLVRSGAEVAVSTAPRRSRPPRWNAFAPSTSSTRVGGFDFLLHAVILRQRLVQERVIGEEDLADRPVLADDVFEERDGLVVHGRLSLRR